MKIARSVASVSAGFLLFLGLLKGLNEAVRLVSGAPPSGYLALSVLWTIVAAAMAGFVTAWIAASHEFPHAAGVGLLIAAMGFYSIKAAGASRPDWSQIALVGCGPISVMIGAGVRLLVRTGQTAKSNTSGLASRR